MSEDMKYYTVEITVVGEYVYEVEAFDRYEAADKAEELMNKDIERWGREENIDFAVYENDYDVFDDQPIQYVMTALGAGVVSSN